MHRLIFQIGKTYAAVIKTRVGSKTMIKFRLFKGNSNSMLKETTA